MPTSALAEAMHGPRWSITDQLLALIYDVLNIGNWQRAGKRSAPKPKPLLRPWQKAKSTSLGSDPIPISEFADWWDSKAKKRGSDGRRRRARNRLGPAGLLGRGGAGTDS